MKLRNYTLEQLGELVVGDHEHFPYRSSSNITRFFSRCDLTFVHDGTTRHRWAGERLKELNNLACASTAFPADAILTVINELIDIDDFASHNLSREAALESLNKILHREGLEAYFPTSQAEGYCRVRSRTGGSSGPLPRPPRPLSSVNARFRPA